MRYLFTLIALILLSSFSAQAQFYFCANRDGCGDLPICGKFPEDSPTIFCEGDTVSFLNCTDSIWVDTTNFVFVKSEMYDEDKELWKVLSMHEVEKIGNYWTPKKIEMKNVQKESRTVMTMDKIEYDIKISDKKFSERSLKR